MLGTPDKEDKVDAVLAIVGDSLSSSKSELGMSLFCFFSHLFFFPAILLFSTYFSEYFA